jgi:hypothetical protein
MAPELFCFSDATRLGGVDVVSLIQIKQIRTGGTHCAHDKVCKPARFRFGERTLSEQIHPMAPHHLPFYLAPGSGTDVLMVVMGIFLVAALVWVGTLYLRLHSLPERMAHKSEKLQFEIVAILGLLALFTHIHLFWVAGLLLAMIDIPDFGTPLRSIAGSVEKIADTRSDIGVEADQEVRSDLVSLSPHLPEKKSANVAKEARGGHV